MPDSDDHLVDRADEQRHQPGDDPLWNESYYLDFVAEDGALAGYARIGLYPNLGVTWWTTMIVGADRPLISSVAFDLPVAGGSGLGIEADGFDVTGTVDRTADGDDRGRYRPGGRASRPGGAVPG